MAVTVMAVFALSALLTWTVRNLARRYALLDHPNARSSHTLPTPHGGGIAVMISLFGGLLWSFYDDGIPLDTLAPLVCVLPVTLVSLIDDLHPLGSRIRIAVQGSAAALFLVVVGGVDVMNFGPFLLEGVWLNLPAWLFILWMTNLYNFLDGIDGYAGSEAVFAGAAAFALFGSEPGLLIAAASAGFLLFNWHKASIFMGDVGSTSLGFLFALLALQEASSPNFLGWIVLLSLFWFDASITLWRRWRRGERLSQAHKKHAYQRLQQSGTAPDGVVLRGMGLNMVIFLLLLSAGPAYYWLVLFASLALLWSAMNYFDRQRPFS